MQVSVEQAKKVLSELIQSLEKEGSVTIVEDGRPVAQLVRAPEQAANRAVVFGGMIGRVKLNPGWDEKLDWNELLGETN